MTRGVGGVLQRHAGRGDLAQSGRGGDRIGTRSAAGTAIRPRRASVGRASGRTGAASTAGSRRRQLGQDQRRLAPTPAPAAAPAATGSNSSTVGSARPRNGSGASNAPSSRSATDRRARLDRPVQHRGRTHRRQQQHGRLGRQRGQFRQARAARCLGRQQRPAATRRSAAPACRAADPRRRGAPFADAIPRDRGRRPRPPSSFSSSGICSATSGVFHRRSHENGTIPAQFGHDSRKPAFTRYRRALTRLMRDAATPTIWRSGHNVSVALTEM